ncbi:MAG: exopolysaccharide biosynthesis protein [Rhodobacteraceae bacterium]|nr:exopolysaccharide biosynthesis protein [Paracoccaceae bacterium]
MDGFALEPSLSNTAGTDTQDMTQQGFKRFRRKNRPAEELGEQPVPAVVSPEPEEEAVSQSTPKPEPDQLQEALQETLLLDQGERIQLPAHPPEIWDMLRQVPLGVRKGALRRAGMVSFFRTDPAAGKFDHLRTRLLQALKAQGWNRVAVAAPTSGCGCTFTTVNLALSLARVPETRTILMDLNHRQPGVGKALDIAGVGDMPGFLAGRVPIERHLVRCGDTLAVGVTAQPDDNASEMLHDSLSASTLNQMCEELRPDVVLYDLPPVLEHDDLMAFLPQVDGVLLVADGTRTTADDLAACERVLESQTQLLGVVLNRGR